MSRLRSGLANVRRRYRCYCEPIGIVSGPGSIYGNLTSLSLSGLLDTGNSNFGLDDGEVPIPMGNMVFNFFGTNFSNNIYWSSNNALMFGTANTNLEVNIPRNIPSILLGNYDRILKAFYYKNVVTQKYSMTIILLFITIIRIVFLTLPINIK